MLHSYWPRLRPSSFFGDVSTSILEAVDEPLQAVREQQLQEQVRSSHLHSEMQAARGQRSNLGGSRRKVV